MAKKDKQDEVVNAIDSEVSIDAAQENVPPVPVVEKQVEYSIPNYSSHGHQHDPNRAVEPGRDEKPAHIGAQGELEGMIIDALKNNDQALAAGCEMLLVKLGELQCQYSAFKLENSGKSSKKLDELFSS